MKYIPVWLAVVILFSCRPLVTTFDVIQDAVYYLDSSQETADFNNTLKVMTWNIRFGAGRIPFFGDSCGDRVLMTEEETIGYLQAIANYIDTMVIKPDILLLQEVDVSSKRSAYVDQLQWLLNNTHFKYGVFASMWETEIIPQAGLGRINTGNAILSRWEITDAERIKLDLRNDQDALTQYFYLRRNILKAKILLPIAEDFYVVDIHATAFAKDNTKQKHIDKYKAVLDGLNQPGTIFVSGGDLNSIPTPTENDSIDFCIEDMCSGESFHSDTEGGPHREGSYFKNFPEEPELISPLYESFLPAIPVALSNNSEQFTHSPWNTNYDKTNFTDNDYWDRKLDYLFTNSPNGFSNGTTHQEAHQLSDHAPVSAILDFSSP